MTLHDITQHFGPGRGGAARLGGRTPSAVGAPPSRTRVFAHRGASADFPEHTRAAYLRAIESGADGLEIDVHLTADGELVCFHDFTVERTSDGSGPVAGKTLAQMRRLDICSWKTPKLARTPRFWQSRRLADTYGAPDEQLMTLPEVLELLRGAGRPMALAIELKHPSPYGSRLEDEVLKVLLAAGWDPETSVVPGTRRRGGEAHPIEVSFMSFDPGALLHLGEMVPAERLCSLFDLVTDRSVARQMAKMQVGFGMRPFVAAVLRGTAKDAEALVWNHRAGIAGPGVRYVRQRPAEVRAWIARGSVMRVWTADKPKDVEMLLDLGVAEITTNRPAQVLDQVTAAQSESAR
ncbi:glycerophosphodiester phosphodiesterase [Nesterenkonia marinintestina]|uniref:glycerophosphodiester phosphodiesterase n=1 Tax=Nesterenkonia marinintestina TaxID=2979865 RepID=UPI0021BF2FC1|nr:glycerophosphodiester phosphodiesterase family protein [Nesterenkonia sp. GX14115]